MNIKKIIAGFIVIVSSTSIFAQTQTPPAPTPNLTPVRLQLEWYPQGQFGGYFAAKELGYYNAEGLDVEILPGDAEVSPAAVLVHKNAEFAIAWLPKVIDSPEAYQQLVNIAQIFQRSGTLQVSFKDTGIKQIFDLKGKRVGSWGKGDQLELFAAMRKFGINPNDPKEISIVPQGDGIDIFLARGIDSAQAMVYNEYYRILESKNPKTGKKYTAKDLNVINFNDAAINTAMLQDGLYARKDWLANPQNQDVTIRFLRATFKGWIYCRDHEKQCIKLSLKQQGEPDKKLTHWQITQVNKLIWPSPLGIGIMNPQAFNQTIAIMQQEKLINFQPNPSIYRTDLATAALNSIKAQDVQNSHEKKGWLHNIFSVFKF